MNKHCVCRQLSKEPNLNISLDTLILAACLEKTGSCCDFFRWIFEKLQRYHSLTCIKQNFRTNMVISKELLAVNMASLWVVALCHVKKIWANKMHFISCTPFVLTILFKDIKHFRINLKERQTWNIRGDQRLNGTCLDANYNANPHTTV